MVVVCRRMPDENFQFEYLLGPLLRYQPTPDKENDIRTLTQLYTTELEKADSGSS